MEAAIQQQQQPSEEYDEVKFVISKKKDMFRKQIRAKKQNEHFQKKRIDMFNINCGIGSTQNNGIETSELNTYNAMKTVLQDIIVNQNHLNEYLNKICSDIKNEYLKNHTHSEVLCSCISILKIYSQKVDEYPHIATIILDNKILQTLQGILTVPSLNMKQLQLDTLCIISNLTYSDQDNAVKMIENNFGLIDVLVNMIKDQDISFITHAIYSLANMSQEYLDVRDEALKRGVAESITEKYKYNKQNKKFVEIIIWFIYIFSFRPHPYELDYQNKIRCFIPILDEQLAAPFQSQENIKFIVESILNLSQGDEEKIQSILEMKNITRLFQLSSKGTDKIPLYIYQIMNNLTYGNVEQLQKLIDINFLEYMSYGFEKNSKNIKVEVCLSINNLMCSTDQIIDHVINHRYLFPKVLTYIQTGNFVQKKELLFALGNFCMNANINQINFLRQKGLFNILIDSFQYEDIEIISSTLGGITNLLYLGRQNSSNQQNNNLNQYLIAFENLGLSRHLLQLQQHEDDEIYKKSENIITQFYDYQ